MAGWSVLTDAPALDCVEVLQNLRSNGFYLDLDSSMKGRCDGAKDKLRCLFNQILSLFLKKISISEDIRPLPAMVGDGRSVDLFKLFLAVREKGGYDSTSKNGLWDSVAEESGLDSEFASSVKLIYTKYLNTLDRWLHTTLRDRRIGDLLPVELEMEFRGLLFGISDQKKKDGRYSSRDLGKSEPSLMAAEKFNTNKLSLISQIEDDDDVVILDPAIMNEDAFSHRRKRESLSGMLNLVTELAKNPSDLAIETFSERSKGKVFGLKELLGQALLAREAVLGKIQVNSSSEESPLQKRQKIHPSEYENHSSADHQSTERLTYQKLSPRKSHLHSCYEPCSDSQIDLDRSIVPCRTGLENHCNKGSLARVDSLTSTTIVSLFSKDHLQKQIPIGLRFQAEVPDWTGVPYESDSKWLGTKIWTLEVEKCPSPIERDPIGKGRQDSCDCCFPGSVECVRFHIAEKRMRLKLELGVIFYRWKFNSMGEEVSLSWTEEEEKKFKDIVRLNPPSLGKCFWDQIFKCFRTKTRKYLVSYYFNVFLLRRRIYQNRVTPNNIDSDDDESEFGAVSTSFGHGAVKVPGSKSIFCVQNKQCIDLEDISNVD